MLYDLNILGNTYCNNQPWQAFEKTLGCPSVTSFAPRRFSLALARLGSEAHLRGFGIAMVLLNIGAQGITAKFFILSRLPTV